MNDSTHATDVKRCGVCRIEITSMNASPTALRKGGYCRTCSSAYMRSYWLTKDRKRIICEKCGVVRQRDARGCCRCEYATCLLCAKAFDPKRRGGKYPKYCTKECATRASYRRRRDALLSASAAAVAPRECRWCFKTFTPSAKGNRATYCGKSCLTVAMRHQDTHRAPDRCHIPMCRTCGSLMPLRPKGASLGHHSLCGKCQGATERIRKGARAIRLPDGSKVSAAQIADRDGWTCHLCLNPIDPTVDTNDRWGVTLDHVIPLARGGTHTLGNLRLAHRGCNSRKGARVASPGKRQRETTPAARLF